MGPGPGPGGQGHRSLVFLHIPPLFFFQHLHFLITWRIAGDAVAVVGGFRGGPTASSFR